MNYYLIGMPGCGKSTVGRRAAAELALSFVDLDDYIVKRAGKTIPQIFEQGEAVFREWESQCLKELSEETQVVIATGGGIVTRPENIRVMKQSGRVIWIDTPVDTILARTNFDGRPLLKDNVNHIHILYQQRKSLYEQAADVVIQSIDLQLTVHQVKEALV